MIVSPSIVYPNFSSFKIKDIFNINSNANYTSIINHMNKLFILSLVVLLVVGEKILVVLDNKALESTHS